MESEAKFRYDSSWSTAQTMQKLSETLSAGNEIVITTSGSTGTPKEITLASSALIFSARNSNKFVNAKPGDRWSLLLSPEHVAGLNVLVRSIELGTSPVTVNESSDFTAIVPTQLFRALNGDNQLLDHLRGCRAVLVGGAASDLKLLDAAKKAGIKCITTYGMTETCGGCVYDGKPLDGVEIRVADTIQIKGPMLAKVPTVDGYFVTQDLGKIVDGKLEITGRADDVIISGGKNISLSAVENLLGDGIAAIGIADDEWGTALHIAVANHLNETEIQKMLSEAFGIKARAIKSVNEIPRTAIGKIDRVALGKLLA